MISHKNFSKSAFVQKIKEKVGEKKSFSLSFTNLWSSPKALIATIIKNKIQQDLLIITSGKREDDLFEDLSLLNQKEPLEFPAWDALPGDALAPSPDLIGKRFETLHKLAQKKEPTIVIAPLGALLIKTLKKSSLKKYSLHWKKGSVQVFEKIPALLTSLGYTQSSLVTDKGLFAVRGGIVDIFPTSSSMPYRIEFFGDEVDELRCFDPMSQKSVKKAKEVFISPSREDALLIKDPSLKGNFLLDYLSADPLIIFDDPLAIEDDYLRFRKLAGQKNPLVDHWETFFHKTKEFSRLIFSNEKDPSILDLPLTSENFDHPFITAADFLQKEDASFPDDLEALVEKATETHLFFDSEKCKNIIQESLPSKLLDKKTCSFHEGNLSSGFVLEDLKLALISPFEITHRKKIRRQKWRQNFHAPESEFHHLKNGDPVVHYHSGIGIYRGIEKQKNHLGLSSEFLLIEYAKGAKLFVPFSQAHLVNRYIGTHEEESPIVHELGSKKWQRSKLSAQKQIIGYAADLLDLYAKRSMEKGFTYREDSSEMELFEMDFPYDETQDQLKAIAEIKYEMLSSQPMDRLLCGDVGYGKTEVAMRSAFKAVIDGNKQVAVLVPTTILAMQHYDSFKERMDNYAITVDVLSRFKTARQNKETLEKAKQGKVDILIGTHRLLSQDVSFKNLGLIIIDEEQRFGVRAKEHLKKKKNGLDTLALSATPIPRTLYFSLLQLRKMSVINTPPQDRLPVKNIVATNEDKVIKEAILRELARDGQVFFIHNRVESIEKRADYIRDLVPEATSAIVHGQMNPDEIDKIFHEFKTGQTDILFATTIVENGVDVPNANTILVDNADNFGLADLYQLKGRVGRWNRSAYAYFLTAKNKKLTDIAKKRLGALVEAGSFGGGMRIAMRDLEIRGSGEILGTQQSGQVSSIGFHLYCKLLKKTIAALKNKKNPVFVETQLEFPFDGKIPEEYIPETELRMELYHRIGEAFSYKEIDSILSEMKDRFGMPPLDVIWIYRMARIRIFASINQFTHLKIKEMFLNAKQIIGTKKIEKVLMMPKLITTPQEMETLVIERLQKSFDSTVIPD